MPDARARLDDVVRLLILAAWLDHELRRELAGAPAPPRPALAA
jgi:hypothetical protein